MGCYVNPKEISKEEWLYQQDEGTEKAPAWEFVPKGMLPVCLVDNGGFTAAAVAYSESERDRFDEEDGRPKKWFLIPIDDLYQVSDLDRWFL